LTWKRTVLGVFLDHFSLLNDLDYFADGDPLLEHAPDGMP